MKIYFTLVTLITTSVCVTIPKILPFVACAFLTFTVGALLTYLIEFLENKHRQRPTISQEMEEDYKATHGEPDDIIFKGRDA